MGLWEGAWYKLSELSCEGARMTTGPFDGRGS